MAETKIESCPSCGNFLTYSAEKNGLVCDKCGYFRETKKELEKAQAKPAVNFEHKTCSQCGAEITLNEYYCTSYCPSCDSMFLSLPDYNSDKLRKPDGMSEAKITKEDAQKRFMEYLCNSNTVPDDILDKVKVISTDLIYLPFWWHQGDCSGHYSCSVGYDRTETYTEYVKKYRDGEEVIEPETKTRTVTDWRPLSGSTSSSYIYTKCATPDEHWLTAVKTETEKAALEKAMAIPEIKSLCSELASFSNKNNIAVPIPFDEERFLGAGLGATMRKLSYSSSSDHAYSALRSQVSGTAPGDHVKDIRITGLTYDDDPAICVASPFYKVQYEYDGNGYIYVVDASRTDGDDYGTHPTVNEKQYVKLLISDAATWTGLSVFFASICIGIFWVRFLFCNVPTYSYFHSWLLLSAATFFGVAIGAYRSRKILAEYYNRQSSSLRNTILPKYLAHPETMFSRKSHFTFIDALIKSFTSEKSEIPAIDDRWEKNPYALSNENAVVLRKSCKPFTYLRRKGKSFYTSIIHGYGFLITISLPAHWVLANYTVQYHIPVLILFVICISILCKRMTARMFK